MTAAVLPEAEAELEQAFDYYEDKQNGLGAELVSEFRKGLDRILENPSAWQKLGDVYRRYRLHRFPFGIVYRRVTEADQTIIVAVMHLSKQPGYWRIRDRG